MRGTSVPGLEYVPSLSRTEQLACKHVSISVAMLASAQMHVVLDGARQTEFLTEVRMQLTWWSEVSFTGQPVWLGVYTRTPQAGNGLEEFTNWTIGLSVLLLAI